MIFCLSFFFSINWKKKTRFDLSLNIKIENPKAHTQADLCHISSTRGHCGSSICLPGCKWEKQEHRWIDVWLQSTVFCVILIHWAYGACNFHRHSSHNVVTQRWCAEYKTNGGRWAQARACAITKKKGLYDDFFERQPGTSPRSAEQLPLDSDSSRLKCEHRSGISCWFPLTASFIKLWKGKRNLRSVPADTDILEMMLLETASNPELRYLYSGIHCVDTKDPAGFILANRQQLSWMLSSFQVV